jgi:hypothetical protein
MMGEMVSTAARMYGRIGDAEFKNLMVGASQAKNSSEASVTRRAL